MNDKKVKGNNMTKLEIFITILMAIIATFIDRVLPLFLFSKNKSTPDTIKYLGRVLPAALFSFLVVYCFKDINFTKSPYGIPEIIAFVYIIIIHLIFRKLLLSIFTGTLMYMWVLAISC